MDDNDLSPMGDNNNDDDYSKCPTCHHLFDTDINKISSSSSSNRLPILPCLQCGETVCHACIEARKGADGDYYACPFCGYLEGFTQAETTKVDTHHLRMLKLMAFVKNNSNSNYNNNKKK